MTENTHLQTEATTLVKTFGKPSRPSPESSKIADINLPQLQLNGNKIDILIGMFDQEGVIASKEVKESLAVIVLESAKALQMDIDEIIAFSKTQPGKVSMTALGVGMINQVRPATSQMGVSIPSATSAKTELVNRNIIA